MTYFRINHKYMAIFQMELKFSESNVYGRPNNFVINEESSSLWRHGNSQDNKTIKYFPLI